MKPHASIFLLTLIGLTTIHTGEAVAYITVYGAPGYSYTTNTGYQFPGEYDEEFVPSIGPLQPVMFHPGDGVSDFGVAVGFSRLLPSSQGNPRPLRWDASGSPGIEMGNLGVGTIDGTTTVKAFAVNNAGASVGFALSLNQNGTGTRAVRWDATGGITELGHLGLWGHLTESKAYAINDLGTAVGFAGKHSQTIHGPDRAVRWEAGGTTAVELGLPANTDENSHSNAIAINASGVVAGWVGSFEPSNESFELATRWDPSGIPSVLGDIGSGPSRRTRAIAVNDAGTVVGFADRRQFGFRAVRWDAGGTLATELGKLVNYPGDQSYSYAFDVNRDGDAVGSVSKYIVGLDNGRNRAVRWDESGSAATELDGLEFDTNQPYESGAYAINDNGLIAGYIAPPDATAEGARAVVWLPNGRAIDLNKIIDSASGWSLNFANGISNAGWVTGIGVFDPDGPGGSDQSYQRLFLLHIPEPSSMLLSLAGLAAFLGWRHRG